MVWTTAGVPENTERTKASALLSAPYILLWRRRGLGREHLRAITALAPRSLPIGDTLDRAGVRQPRLPPPRRSIPVAPATARQAQPPVLGVQTTPAQGEQSEGGEEHDGDDDPGHMQVAVGPDDAPDRLPPGEVAPEHVVVVRVGVVAGGGEDGHRGPARGSVHGEKVVPARRRRRDGRRGREDFAFFAGRAVVASPVDRLHLHADAALRCSALEGFVEGRHQALVALCHRGAGALHEGDHVREHGVAVRFGGYDDLDGYRAAVVVRGCRRMVDFDLCLVIVVLLLVCRLGREERL